MTTSTSTDSALVEIDNLQIDIPKLLLDDLESSRRSYNRSRSKRSPRSNIQHLCDLDHDHASSDSDFVEITLDVDDIPNFTPKLRLDAEMDDLPILKKRLSTKLVSSFDLLKHSNMLKHKPASEFGGIPDDTLDLNDHTTSTNMTYNYEATDLLIYKAALSNDWESVSEIFKKRPELMTKRITRRLETALMVAMGTNCSHDFASKLVDGIKSLGRLKELVATNFEGNTALHYAAKVGNQNDASKLLSENRKMTLLENFRGDTPLILAASHGRKEMIQLLLRTTPLVREKKPGTSHYPLDMAGNLITLTIQAGFVDVALKIVDRYLKVVPQDDWHSQRALEVLATKPEFFPSGSKLGFWSHLIYSLIHVYESEVIQKTHNERAPTHLFSYENENFEDDDDKTARFTRVRQYIASTTKNIRDIKEKHICSNILVNSICKIVITKAQDDAAWKIFGTAILTAIRYGTYEVIEECILAYPSIIWYDYQGYNLFHLAIKERQVQVYNLVYQMTGHKSFIASQIYDEEKENALHIAAKLAPPHRLNIITGAALQMQRELQWFKVIIVKS